MTLLGFDILFLLSALNLPIELTASQEELSSNIHL